jgi:hypothetical protein
MLGSGGLGLISNFFVPQANVPGSLARLRPAGRKLPRRKRFPPE